jgi:hypothetical protein
VSGQPQFSVLVPTHDRPDLVAMAVASVVAQRHADFEVIVSDDPVRAPCDEAISAIGDERVRYLRTEGRVSMADNWEHALAAAQGEYVCVLLDKSALLPDALAVAAASLERTPVDIVTWWNEGFTPVAEGERRGWYEPYFQPGTESAYDPRDVLRRRLSFQVRRGAEGIDYFRGKICFGAFSRSLIERIRAKQGKVFFPIAPDYTSRAAGSWLATSAVDLGRPLMLSYRTDRSNGLQYRIDASHARQFIVDSGVNLLDELPIPGLYASSHNLTAHDLVTTLARVAGDEAPPLDRAQLILRAAEDVELVQHWASADQEREQRAVLDAAINTLDPDQQQAVRTAVAGVHRQRLRARTRLRISGLLTRHQSLRALEARVRRPWAVPRKSSSILAATELVAQRSK